jgi:hypothetical protein
LFFEEFVLVLDELLTSETLLLKLEGDGVLLCVPDCLYFPQHSELTGVLTPDVVIFVFEEADNLLD